MKNYKGIIALTIASVAIGTAACLLLACKEGDKATKNNKFCIKKIGKLLGKKSKKCAKRVPKTSSKTMSGIESKSIPVT